MTACVVVECRCRGRWWTRNIAKTLQDIYSSLRKTVARCYLLSVQWLRSVVKYGGGVRVSQVAPSNCFRLHPTSKISKHPTIRVPDSLCRRLEKLPVVLPSIFDTSLSSSMLWNLRSYPTTVLNERMWHFYGRGQNILWSLIHIFRGQDPQPLSGSTPLLVAGSSQWWAVVNYVVNYCKIVEWENLTTSKYRVVGSWEVVKLSPV